MSYSRFWPGATKSILGEVQGVDQMNHTSFLRTPLSPAIKLPAVLVVLLAVSFVRICVLILLLLLTTRKQTYMMAKH